MTNEECKQLLSSMQILKLQVDNKQTPYQALIKQDKKTLAILNINSLEAAIQEPITSTEITQKQLTPLLKIETIYSSLELLSQCYAWAYAFWHNTQTLNYQVSYKQNSIKTKSYTLNQEKQNLALLTSHLSANKLLPRIEPNSLRFN